MFRTVPFKYDVFLSHAFEDQEHIANELNKKLRDAGIRVWYSGNDLKIGQDLHDVILNKVIPQSRYGVIVISRDYFVADWGRRELNLLHSYEQPRKYNVILPVWHEVDEHQIKIQFPYLEGRFALKTEKGLDTIVKQIIEIVKAKQEPPSFSRIRKTLIKTKDQVSGFRNQLLTLSIMLALGAGVYLYRSDIELLFTKHEAFSKAIESRIKAVNALADAQYTHWQYTVNPFPADFSKTRDLRIYFTGTHTSCGRNSFELFTGFNRVTGRKNVQNTGINVSNSLSAYGMDNKTSCIDTSSSLQLSYSILNLNPVQYKIIETSTYDLQIIVKVCYTDPLRCVITTLTRRDINTDCATETTTFYGLKPTEEYVFEQGKGEVKLTAIR